MSQLDTLLTEIANPALDEHLGAAVTLRSRTGTERSAVAIVGPTQGSEDETAEGTRTATVTRQISVAPADAAAGDWTEIDVGGETWTISGPAASESAARTAYRCVRRGAMEKARAGYRRK